MECCVGLWSDVGCCGVLRIVSEGCAVESSEVLWSVVNCCERWTLYHDGETLIALAMTTETRCIPIYVAQLKPFWPRVYIKAGWPWGWKKNRPAVWDASHAFAEAQHGVQHKVGQNEASNGNSIGLGLCSNGGDRGFETQGCVYTPFRKHGPGVARGGTTGSLCFDKTMLVLA